MKPSACPILRAYWLADDATRRALLSLHPWLRLALGSLPGAGRVALAPLSRAYPGGVR